MIHELTIKKFHEGLSNKEFSALEMTEQLYNFIEKEDNVSLVRSDAKIEKTSNTGKRTLKYSNNRYESRYV